MRGELGERERETTRPQGMKPNNVGRTSAAAARNPPTGAHGSSLNLPNICVDQY
jgi:hypothetical protein